MIAEIKRPFEKKAPSTATMLKSWGTAFAAGSIKRYSGFILLFLTGIALFFSLMTNHLFFIKELVVSGLILGFVLVLQIQEHRK